MVLPVTYCDDDVMVDYAKYRVPELKELLKARQLPINGLKAVLVQRLTESDARINSIEEGGDQFQSQAGDGFFRVSITNIIQIQTFTTHLIASLLLSTQCEEIICAKTTFIVLF